LETEASHERRWLCGGYPDGGVLRPGAYPQWGLDYLSLLTQRDLPAWGLPAKPSTTDRLLRMLAALHGQVWNASQIGRSLGVSYHTVNDYLDYLIGAFLIRRLPSYQANIRKRLVKSPKVYWRDTGLLHALLKVPDEHALFAQPWVGASWEGHVVEQAIGELTARGTVFEPYFLRTSDGRELDLVLDFGGELWAVEAKLTASPGPSDMRRLDSNADLIGAARRFLVCRAARPSLGDRSSVCDLETFLALLRQA
jgi:predicted AAA+ superfamily ATPase